MFVAQKANYFVTNYIAILILFKVSFCFKKEVSKPIEYYLY